MKLKFMNKLIELEKITIYMFKEKRSAQKYHDVWKSSCFVSRNEFYLASC